VTHRKQLYKSPEITTKSLTHHLQQELWDENMNLTGLSQFVQRDKELEVLPLLDHLQRHAVRQPQNYLE
jgi:hypothetical protein